MRYFVLFLLMIGFVSAGCQDNQIDINSASLEKLDKLTGIGPVKAQAIIDTRPFECVDDLINVYGIGEKTLEKIKLQGLACVLGEEVVYESKNSKILKYAPYVFSLFLIFIIVVLFSDK